MSDTPPSMPAKGPDRTWEVLCHATAISGYIGVPFGNIAGPLIVWLMKRSEMPAVDEHGKEALNFHLSMTLYALISGVLTLVFIGFLMLIVVWIAGLVLTIVGSVKASNGELYRYPVSIRFIK